MVKKNILVFFPSPQTKKIFKYEIDKLPAMIDLFPNNYYFFTTVQKKRVEKFIFKKDRYKEIIDGTEYIKNSSWKESFKILDKMQKKYNFKKIILVTMPFFGEYICGNEELFINQYNKILKKDDYSMSFLSMKTYFKKAMLPIRFLKKYDIPILQIVWDVLAPNFKNLDKRNKQFYYYDNKERKCVYFPFVEYGHIYKHDIKIPEKEYDFVFAGSTVSNIKHYRYKAIKILLEMKNEFKKEGLKHKLFVKSKSLGIDTSITAFEYNDNYILKSKYTLVLPGFNEKEFSVNRFWEALLRKTIPLIAKRANYEQAFIKEFPILLKKIKKHDLIVSRKNLIHKIKSLDYKKIIDDLTNCEDFKKLKDINFYNRYKKKFQGIF